MLQLHSTRDRQAVSIFLLSSICATYCTLSSGEFFAAVYPAKVQALLSAGTAQNKNSSLNLKLLFLALDLMVDTMHPLDRESAKPETISGIAKDALNEQDVFEDSFYAWQMRYSYYTRIGRPVNRIRKIFLTNLRLCASVLLIMLQLFVEGIVVVKIKSCD